MQRIHLLILSTIGLAGLIAAGLWGYSSMHVRMEPAVETPATVAVEMGDVVQTVDAPGQLLRTKEIYLSMGASGYLEEIFVRPGDVVEEGQLLVKLAGREAVELAVLEASEAVLAAEKELQEIITEAPLVTAQAQMDLAQARDALQQALYTNLIQQEGNRAGSDTLLAAEAKLALVEEEVRQAEKEVNKLSGRSQDDPLLASANLQLAQARQRRDAAQRVLNWYNGHPTEVQQALLDSEIAIAEAELILAQGTWERVKDGPDVDLLSEAQLQLEIAEARLADAEMERAGSELYAPFSGTILEVDARPGEQIAAGAGFVLLGAPAAVEVIASVVEEDYPQVEIGQSVELFFDARPEAELLGQVDRIVPARLPGDRPLYAVYVSFDELPEGLVSGMTVDASIITASRENVLRLPKSLVRSQSDGSARIEIWVEGHREVRIVRVGLRGDAYVEITTGLQAGDLVVAE
jgi:multidrug efflux pump subunit AcrA (membrane-fusion protein)